MEKEQKKGKGYNEISWSKFMGNTRLIVSHYLFFSEEWEMHVEWHIMVPPYDWAKIDLRHMFDEQETKDYLGGYSSGQPINSLSGWCGGGCWPGRCQWFLP